MGSLGGRNFEEAVRYIIKHNIQSGIEILQLIEKIQSEERSKESVTLLKEMIDKSELPAKIKKALYKMHKTFHNRLVRSVPESFGMLIRNLRLSKGWSLKTMAEKVGGGVSSGYIHRLEIGERLTPSHSIVVGYAEVFGLDTKDLLGIGNEASEIEAIPIDQLIIKRAIILNGKRVNRAQKEALIDLLQTAITVEWTNESKYLDAIQFIEEFDKFRKVFDSRSA
jgi:transcriptional regulator with XRE-family HTH domain